MNNIDKIIIKKWEPVIESFFNYKNKILTEHICNYCEWHSLSYYDSRNANDLTDKLNEINTQLNILKESSLDEKEAYEGTLLMKKSGLVANAKEKLSLFKTGRMKLEASISKDTKNAEYRFLRIIIQEHAPKIVKYRNELEADSRLILDNYKNLPQFLQQVINDYSKKSKVLKNL